MLERFGRRSRPAARLVGAVTMSGMLAGCQAPSEKLATKEAVPESTESGAWKPTLRAVCSDYRKAMADSAYPRDAIARGLDYGKVIVRFRVDGSSVSVLSVDASDTAFAVVATGMVLRFGCRSDQPVNFEIPFTFQRE